MSYMKDSVDPYHSTLVGTAMRERTGSRVNCGDEKNLGRVQ